MTEGPGRDDIMRTEDSRGESYRNDTDRDRTEDSHSEDAPSEVTTEPKIRSNRLHLPDLVLPRAPRQLSTRLRVRMSTWQVEVSRVQPQAKIEHVPLL